MAKMMIKRTRGTDTVVVSCVDSRLQDRIFDAVTRTFGVRSPMYLTYLGGARSLAIAHAAPEKIAMMDALTLMVRYLGIRHVILLNHAECHAYRLLSRKIFTDAAAERQFHQQELIYAAQVVPCLACVDSQPRVSLGFITFKGGGLVIEPVPLSAEEFRGERREFALA